jgi:hypothetical protein
VYVVHEPEYVGKIRLTARAFAGNVVPSPVRDRSETAGWNPWAYANRLINLPTNEPSAGNQDRLA